MWIAASWYVHLTVFLAFCCSYLIDYTEQLDQETWKGYVYTFLFFVSSVVYSCFFHQLFHIGMTLGMRVKAALIAAVYSKVWLDWHLRLPGVSHSALYMPGQNRNCKVSKSLNLSTCTSSLIVQMYDLVPNARIGTIWCHKFMTWIVCFMQKPIYPWSCDYPLANVILHINIRPIMRYHGFGTYSLLSGIFRAPSHQGC